MLHKIHKYVHRLKDKAAYKLIKIYLCKDLNFWGAGRHFSRHVQTCPELSKLVQSCPYLPKIAQIGQTWSNVSKHIQIEVKIDNNGALTAQ